MRKSGRRHKKNTTLRVLLKQHNQKENPVSRETAIVLITLWSRILEQIWTSCGPDEVYKVICSTDHKYKKPDPADFTFTNDADRV